VVSTVEARMLAESEAGQRRAGHALHRDVSPGLAAAILELNLLLREPPGALAEATPAAVARALGALAASVAAARAVELSLRPPLLEEAGLGPPLRWLADQEGAGVELPDTVPRLPAALEWQLYQSVATLLRQGLRGKRTIAVAARPFTVRLTGARTRRHAEALAAARARLGHAQVQASAKEIRLLPRAAGFRSRRTPPRTFR
jgi:hypothetical protein